MITPTIIRIRPIIVGITIIAVIKYKQIPNIPTIIGLSLIVVGVIIVHLMNDIDVK
mgnify:CR=1 FL=1